MNCPIDGSSLHSIKRYGMEVDECQECKGIWLDYSELDELEDREFSMDLDKGSIMLSSETSNLVCPVCGTVMKRFDYRLHDLKLDLCPELHGFWLDRNEDQRVLQLMDEREEDIDRKIKAEAEWAKTLNNFRSPTFLDKVKELLR